MFYFTPPHPYHYYVFLNEIYICNAPSIKPVWFHVRVQTAHKISLFQIKLKSNCWNCYIMHCNHRKAVNNIHINLSGIYDCTLFLIMEKWMSCKCQNKNLSNVNNFMLKQMQLLVLLKLNLINMFTSNMYYDHFSFRTILFIITRCCVVKAVYFYSHTAIR